MVKKKPDIKDIQRRVGDSSIGASTLRSQGAEKMVEKARIFVDDLDLAKLNNITEKQFKNRLNRMTKKLMKRFPKGGKNNWGAARKAINVFLENAFYNRFLAKKYNLHRLENFLELPLDNLVVKELKKHYKNLPKWNGIKNLEQGTSDEFQRLAKNLADKKGISRIYLDLEFWGRTNRKQ